MEIFHQEERFGKDLSNSKKRIDELKTAHASLKELIDHGSEKGQILKINCVIEILY